MTEHYRQIGNTCALTSCSMAAGCSEKEYREVLLPIYGNKPMSVSDLAPMLMSYSWVLGSAPDLGVNPVKDQIGENTISVAVDRQLYGAVVRLAERDEVAPENYFNNLVLKHLEDKGVSLDECDYSPENGADGEELATKTSFLITVPMEGLPALVSVNTWDGARVGHLVYWDGYRVFDPACDGVKDDFTGYSIRHWMPVRKIGGQVEQWSKLMEKRKNLADLKRREELQRHQEPIEMAEPVRIKIINSCLVREEATGEMFGRAVGSELIVSAKDARDLIRMGRAVEVNNEET